MSTAPPSLPARRSSRYWLELAVGYACAILLPPMITAAVEAIHSSSVSAAGYAYLYLGAVTLVALVWGLGPALVSAVGSAGFLDYYFVPPVGRLSINSPQDLENLALFLVAAVVVGLLAVGRRRQQRRAQDLAQSLLASNIELERRRVEAEEGRRAALELATVSSRVEALAEADRLKTELLANVSHELRTPLGAIVGLSSALIDADAPAVVREYAETINSEGRHLARLVGDLLEMSRLDAGVSDARLDAVDSLEAQESAAERAGQLHPGALVEVRGEHFLVLADDSRLQGVLLNLVENAARYGTPIELTCVARDGRAHFEVADRGPGVPDDEREAIFERFHQVPSPDGAPAFRGAGSGLGLAICRRLVESMDGRIWCEPRQGGGAIFAFELPLYPAAPW